MFSTNTRRIKRWSFRVRCLFDLLTCARTSFAFVGSVLSLFFFNLTHVHRSELLSNSTVEKNPGGRTLLFSVDHSRGGATFAKWATATLKHGG